MNFLTKLTPNKRKSARLRQVKPKFPGKKHWFPVKILTVLCWGAVWLAVFMLQLTFRDSFRTELVQGQKADKTIVASVDFSYYHSPDTAFRPIFFFLSSSAPGERKTKNVNAGDILLERNEIVTRAHIEKLRAHNAELNNLDTIGSGTVRLIGDALALVSGLFFCIGFFSLIDEKAVKKPSGILLFFMITIPSIVLAKWLLISPEAHRILPAMVPEGLVPVALTPILACILMSRKAAVVGGFWVSFVSGIFANYSFAVFLPGFAISMLVPFMAERVRSRGKVLRIGFVTGALFGITSFFISLSMNYPWTIMPNQVISGMIGGVFSALIALMLVPLYELMFALTTDMRLMELSAMEHPLLKRMAIEAPGTYHHSLMVANLAQAGAEALGANALLTTVFAYFHDVGKLTKPSFFSENIQFGDNPHDDISPHMSTLVIISHVKEGVTIAMQYKLPAPVIEAIQQHHGSGLVSFFHHKASIQLEMDLYEKGKDAGSAVPEEDFRYPGPKPSTKEIAILSLADAVEAASRSLEKITPGGIEDIVNEVIENKRNDGQLDCCNMTQADIATLRKTFMFSLTNMLHGRISYPSNENSGKQ